MVIFSLILASHSAVYFCGYYFKEAKNCVKVVYLKGAETQKFGAREDGQIHVGVAILNELLSDDEEKNQKLAKTFVVKNNYELIHTEKNLLPGNQVFVFKLLRNENKLASQ